jgi:uncharacterized protein (TIGR02118 family)
MQCQFKKIAFLAPRAGLSHEDFIRYWREIHGPLVAHSVGYAEFRRKYIQNHFVSTKAAGEPFDYAGMAEFWLPGDNEDTFATTSIYQDRIRVDETNFIDLDSTVSMTAVEEIVRPGTAVIKLVVVRRDSARTRIDTIVSADGLCGLTLNHVIGGSFRLPGARPVQGSIECIEELWFDSEATAGQTLAGLDKDEDWSAFLAKEYVFFDNGRPVPALAFD